MDQTVQESAGHATSADALRVAIIVGSTRPGRRADAVARWLYDLAAGREDATFEVIDIADYKLPLLDEPEPPFAGRYSHPHTHKWAATIGSFDAYIFVTPEYNRATSGALKNAIDFLYAEWADKVAGFVGYGVDGGVRAVEHLRLVMGEFNVADVATAVALSIFDDFQEHRVTPRDRHQKNVARMLDELVAWGGALKTLRESRKNAELAQVQT